MPPTEPIRGDERDGSLPAHERSHAGGRSDEALPALKRASAAEFASLAIDAPVAFVVTDRGGHICFANEEFGRCVGRTPGTLLGTTFQAFLPPGGKLFYETQLVPMLLLRGSTREIALDLNGADGQRVPVFMNAVLHRNPQREAGLILISLFEAQQRRAYEKELLRARREFEQMAEVVRRSSDAILRLTPEALVQSWNRGAEQIFGYSEHEILNKPIAELFDSSAVEHLSTALLDLGTGAEVALETLGVRKDGRRVDLSVSLTPHLDAPGILVAFSAVIRDITARKQSERALLQNEKLASVGRLASSIAHEINNPLEAVTNLLYILQSHVEGEDNHALVATAQAELARVSHIATHTLRFHKQSSARSLVDIQALAHSVLSLYRARLDNSAIAVANNSAAASPLFCFEGELRQILMNLVSNAFDAMRGGGRLTIRARDVTLWPAGVPGVRITVADTGTGMDPEILEHIFDAFFSTKGIGGTGLGLWITRDLVEKNHGTLRVRSCKQPARHGTVFTLLFPHQSQHIPPGAASAT